MSEGYKLFLDQMFRVDVAQAVRKEGCDVLRIIMDVSNNGKRN